MTEPTGKQLWICPVCEARHETVRFASAVGCGNEHRGPNGKGSLERGRPMKLVWTKGDGPMPEFEE